MSCPPPEPLPFHPHASPLTHAGVHDLYPTQGFPPPGCDAPVRLVLEHEGDPESYRVWQCDRCARRVSVDLAAGRILNCYAWPADPRAFVKALAGALSAGREGGA